MNLYRVAVCDDEPANLDTLCSLCQEILVEEGIHHKITPFSSAEDLKKKLDKQSDFFDMIILEIHMGGVK